MGDVAIRWNNVRSLWDPDLEVHRVRVGAAGLDVPTDVFEQLFHEPHSDPLFAVVVGQIDWSGVRWRWIGARFPQRRGTGCGWAKSECA